MKVLASLLVGKLLHILAVAADFCAGHLVLRATAFGTAEVELKGAYVLQEEVLPYARVEEDRPPQPFDKAAKPPVRAAGRVGWVVIVDDRDGHARALGNMPAAGEDKAGKRQENRKSEVGFIWSPHQIPGRPQVYPELRRRAEQLAHAPRCVSRESEVVADPTETVHRAVEWLQAGAG